MKRKPSTDGPLTDEDMAWLTDGDVDVVSLASRAVAELRAARLRITSLEAARTRAVEALGEACDTAEMLYTESRELEPVRLGRTMVDASNVPEALAEWRALATSALATSALAPVGPRPAMTEGEGEREALGYLVRFGDGERATLHFYRHDAEANASFVGHGADVVPLYADLGARTLPPAPACDGCIRGLPTRACAVSGAPVHRDEDHSFTCRALPPAPVEPPSVTQAPSTRRHAVDEGSRSRAGRRAGDDLG